MERPLESRRQPTWVFVLLALVLIVGLALRLPGLRDQVLGGDEHHAVVAALRRGYWGSFTRYGAADHSIPLSLYARALVDLGWFSELTFRLPSLLSGVLLLLAPLLFLRRSGPGVALGTCILLTTSPFAIHYTVAARPYAPAALCVFIAFWSWVGWVETGNARKRWVLVVSASTAIFLHLFALFPLVALFLVTPIFQKNGGPALRSLVFTALLTGGALSLLLGPGLKSLYEHRVDKVGASEGGLERMPDVFSFLVGHVPAIEGLFLILLVLGVVLNRRRQPVIATGCAALLVAQFLALVTLQPQGQDNGWARYLFLVWPVGLFCVATGLQRLCDLLPVRTSAGTIPAGSVPVSWAPASCVPATWAVALGAALLLAGAVPLTSSILLFAPGPHSFRAAKFAVAARDERFVAPELYAALQQEPRLGTLLLEHQQDWLGHDWRGMAAAQQQHGMRVAFALSSNDELEGAKAEHRLHFDLRDADQIRGSGASHLVLRPDQIGARARAELQRRYGEPIAAADHLELYRLR